MEDEAREAVKTARERLAAWLERMTAGLEPGRFRFCAQGSRVPVSGTAGQMATCFAVKAAWHAGIWATWPQERRTACVRFIQSFQRRDGWFCDPWLEKNAGPGFLARLARLRRASPLLSGEEIRMTNRRAETRQSASTLLMVGQKPHFPLPVEVDTVDGIRRYVASFDWTNPWAAASHTGHQMAMLTINRQCLGGPSNYDALIDAVVECLEERRDEKTGCWFLGDPTDTLKINGAMKVLSGLQWLDRPYPDLSRLMDFALAQPFHADGCGFLNRLYVVQQARKGTAPGYRADAVRRLALLVLEVSELFQKPDGGFSFFQKGAQTSYYFACVSRGLPVSDLHGALMITWAIAIALELLGQGSPDGGAGWSASRP